MARMTLVLAVLLTVLSPAAGTVFLPMDDEALVAGSAAVVTGEVIAAGSRRDGRRVVTDATIAVDRVLKGVVTGGTVTVTTPGGSVGDESVVVFGAPRLARGDAVLVFLQQTARGELRPTGLAHGVFRTERAADGTERAIRAEPFPTVRDVDDFAALAQALADPGAAVGDALAPPALFGGGEAFTFLGASPARWFEPDTNTPVRLRVANADPKLGTGGSHAVVDAALAAWTEVPSATITLERGAGTSPALSIASGVCDGVNAVQFGDPEDEIPALDRCTGILAIGGFCAGTEVRVVGGRQFRRIREGDLTLVDGAGGCLNRRGFEEIVTHEVGHVIGLGHSSESPSEPDPTLRDATMYFAVHLDGRGASLRADDVAGVTTAYPVQIDPNDLDGDGVPNAEDDCPTTPAATPADARGCACGEAGHAACDDGLGCTADFCDGATGGCDAGPVDCTDGDPCLTGACDEATGCSTAPVGGDAAVVCAYGRRFPPAACGSVRIPAAVRRAYRTAGRRATRGLGRGDGALLARAAKVLDRARVIVARKAARRGPLDAACAAALDALLADARRRLPVAN